MVLPAESMLYRSMPIARRRGYKHTAAPSGRWWNDRSSTRAPPSCRPEKDVRRSSDPFATQPEGRTAHPPAGGDGRAAVGDCAVVRDALGSAEYTNASAVEFLMDQTGKLYCIEVSARVQMEHLVTEFVTGVDIVKAQIRIAQGETLPEILNAPVTLRGHAIECRINAEGPETFEPSPGWITGFHLPGGIGVRVDTWAYTDCVIPPFYGRGSSRRTCSSGSGSSFGSRAGI
jgi:Carbamoyl-phosphate synthase L chain, ATP binding domain/Biotin carboxylase C-terminal domain